MSTAKEIIDLLGGKEALAEPVKNIIDFDKAIRDGFSWRAGAHLKRRLHFTNRQLAGYLGISESTLNRDLRTKKTMSITVSDRIYRMARVFTLAKEIFGDEKSAHDWLLAPQVGLGERIPFDFIRTEVGEREVEELLRRIEYGVVA